MSKQKSQKTAKTPQADQLPTLTLNHVALILTILDKEAHILKYYARQRPEDEDNYTEILNESLWILANQISPDNRKAFTAINPHLSHLFSEYYIDQIKAHWGGIPTHKSSSAEHIDKDDIVTKIFKASEESPNTL